MSELDRPQELLNPLSGELIPATEIGKIADAVLQIREMELKLQNARRLFASVIIEESRRQGTRTLTGDGYRAEVSAPDELQWDIELLREGLTRLGLSEQRLNELIRQTVEYKVDGNVARQIASVGPEYKAAVEAAKSRVPKAQYVSVKP